MRRLEGQRCLVTGASSGLGAASAIALGRAGARVVLTARRGEALEAVAGVVRAAGGEAEVVVADLSLAADRERLLASAGELDVLVSNAGYGLHASLEETSEAELRHVFETNFFAAWALLKAVVPRMRARRRGRLVVMSSVCAHLAAPGLSAYSASKFALRGACESLRVELRPFGVPVVLVEPGIVRTEAWTQRLTKDEAHTYPQMQAVKNLAVWAEKFGGDADAVGRVVAHAASARSPCARYALPFDGVVGRHWGQLPPGPRDFLLRRALDLLRLFG